LSCHLGQSCTLKPYILVRKALRPTVALRSFQNIYIAARSPRNSISRVFRGVSFARFWQNLANWHAHGVNFIQIVAVEWLCRPNYCVASVTMGGCVVFLRFKIFRHQARKLLIVCPRARTANPGAPSPWQKSHLANIMKKMFETK